MKTTKPPRKFDDASKNGEKGKTHASWPKTKIGESSTAKFDPKLPKK